MPELTITLSEDLSLRLGAEAERLGVQPPELARAILEGSLQRSSDDFLVAARYVLDKNRELYERLS